MTIEAQTRILAEQLTAAYTEALEADQLLPALSHFQQKAATAFFTLRDRLSTHPFDTPADEISYFRIQQTCKDIIQLVENKRNIRVCSCKRLRLAYGTNDEGSLYFRLNWGDTALTKRPYGVRFAALETVFWTDQGKAPFSLSF